MQDTGSFEIVIPIHNQFEDAVKYLSSWFSLAKGRLSVIFIDNGSDAKWAEQIPLEWHDHSIHVLENQRNVGVYPTFAQGHAMTASPWTFYSHSDVEMLEVGWDGRLRRLLREACEKGAGVCGMFGARGIGTPNIYKSAYHFTQMMRWDCTTVESMAGAGGHPVVQNLTQCMVLDGFSLIVKRQMIDDIGGFDHERYPVHHMYDNDICLESHYAGYTNWVLDLDCIHHGGMTSTREKWAEGMGTTDLQIHREAHRVFYDKWRGKLPVGI